MLRRGQAAAGVVGAISQAVTMHDRRPVAVLQILLALGARLDDQG